MEIQQGHSEGIHPSRSESSRFRITQLRSYVPHFIAVTRPVYPDCMVYFENHSYPVPFIHVGREVEVRGCAGRVQILADGKVIWEHPRGTRERLIYDPSCYEGDGDARVIAPPPFGRMGSRLQEIMDMAVEERPVDLYAVPGRGDAMKGRVDIDRACNGLEELGMKYATEALSQFLNTSVKENWAPH